MLIPTFVDGIGEKLIFKEQWRVFGVIGDWNIGNTKLQFWHSWYSLTISFDIDCDNFIAFISKILNE